MSLKYKAIGAMFELLSRSGLTGAVRALSQSRGVIFTLHRVLPEPPRAFSPNGILQVTPDFLDFTLTRIRQLGIDIVTLDEAVERLAADQKPRPFVSLTFDDAYKDNLVHALPILRKHKAPFTLYVPTALVDGTGDVWWQAIEDIIADNANVTFGPGEIVETASLDQKQAAFDTLYWRMRKMPEADRLALLRSFAATHAYDLAKQCRDLVMDWAELQTFADEPLCTIGAHTVHHYELAKLPEAQARDEMVRSADILEQRFGKRPIHFSYPLGGPLSAGQREYDLAAELGFTTGVTTRPGGLYKKSSMLTALPRVSLNGLFQKPRYVDVFATGAVFTWQARLGA